VDVLILAVAILRWIWTRTRHQVWAADSCQEEWDQKFTSRSSWDVLLYSEKSEGLHEAHPSSLNIVNFNDKVIDRFVSCKEGRTDFLCK